MHSDDLFFSLNVSKLFLFTYILHIVSEVDMCMLDQCYNEGTCISEPLSPYGYRCKCPPGIVGNECQIGMICSSF